ncbi:acetyl-CoA carboxylase, biotin carboxylase subunit [Desulfosporosinus acidiphilus SJ4]|uniref:Biotin carboxylase n=1 Tax=Desulfosporosinus acidiphilus (strain DSM 22704 / JCM 16185 / SJ4) TaxID=646529 RepID=I4D4Z9_DESAJ|nr:acetyl-CoA carboxylase biotin carboxylase subunit [Desulfosporosinus acidiphilus]AFM40873.1 acetyl-CoA carboxylase, biotin carboxylase subunit [Desulfosporosinus acidiphilus SJ4]
MFRKILIANRGEIAVRIIRTCREMQVRTIAIYTEADRGSLHVQLADEAVKCVSRAGYLDMDWIIQTALTMGVQAIHPGYGFLAENPLFAEKTLQAGLIFIGPDARIMTLMGDKAKARETMAAAGFPVVPGGSGIVRSAEETLPIARALGYPVLIKAVAGGGGRGMRLVLEEDQLFQSLESASSEANACFGNSDVYLEKYLEGCRHVEIQILADNYGQVVTLGERDCSIQRRHQKLIEESPSPALTAQLRDRMSKVSRDAVKAVAYRGAGTLEYLLDKDLNFYFMEMNTRIQVEHTVTELICGLDLIKEQIRIAAGEPLGYEQSDIRLTGWVMECRINAEDPVTFLPAPGKIDVYRPPGGFGVRVDSAAYSGYTVTPFYDSLISKLLVYGRTRKGVIARMQRALAEFSIQGVKTTIPFHQRILADSDFQRGEFTTDFIQQKLDSENEFCLESSDRPDQDDQSRDNLLAAVLSAAVEAYGDSEHQRYRIINIQTSGKIRSPWRLASLYGGGLL